jgi:DNA-binding transcriptional MocR family regulator
MSRKAKRPVTAKGTYLEIATQLEEEILSERRVRGEQLPTQRQLAAERNVTQGTVHRAYVELARRGLISSEVGRGSFVLDVSRPVASSAHASELIDMAANKPATNVHGVELRRALQRAATRSDLIDLLPYQPAAGAWRHREAAGRWLAGFNVHVAGEEVALTVGAQQGNAAALLALTPPGAVVLVEEFTYTGMKALAHTLGRRLEPVTMDDDGLVPAALHKAAKETGARCLYCMPGLHNPTNAVMSKQRRQAIASVAEHLDLQVIEDGVYDFMVERDLMPLFSLIPHRTVYVTSLSKSVAPGLRVGIIAAREPVLELIANQTQSLLWAAPSLMAEVACDWMDSGVARSLADAHRKECGLRVSIARRVMDHLDFRVQPFTAHMWLRLPVPWTSEAFVVAARRQGVALAPTEAFSVRRGDDGAHVRLGLASPRSSHEMTLGLRRIASTASQSARAAALTCR